MLMLSATDIINRGKRAENRKPLHAPTIIMVVGKGEH